MSTLVAQFGHPKGWLGWLVGKAMAVKNGRRSRWVLSQLPLAPGLTALEVGFGPGVDLGRLLQAVGDAGRVSGVDVSEAMVREARRRNAEAIRSGRLALSQGSVSALPFAAGAFDVALAVNCAQFWPDLLGGFRELRRVVRPGGVAAVAVQPRSRGATVSDSERWRDRLGAAATAAGFTTVEGMLGPTSPPVGLVLAR